MITELGCAFILSKSIQYLFSQERALKDKWKNTLLKCKVDSIRNKENQTFIITKVYKKDYGFLCTINIPTGLSVTALENAKKVLEDNLSCIIELEKERFESYIKVKIINKVLEQEYMPVRTKSHELFLGYKLDSSKFTLDLTKDAHILLAGKTGTGKSFLFSIILANLIYHHSKEIEIYLLQVMKSEIDIFKNCPSVKFTSDNEEEILIITEKIVSIIHKRSKIFASMGVKNINQWNKLYPSQKMKRIIIGAEEISFFMSNEESPCFKNFTNIVKAGRSAGVHFIGLTQRTTCANLPSELKAQMSVITAKQRSEIDSRNAIDIKDAVYLQQQEFIASTNDGYTHFKSVTIDEDYKILNKYLPEIIIPQAKKKNNIPNKLTYEESQKLKVKSEFHMIDNTTVVDIVPPPSETVEPNKTPRVRKGKKGVKAC